MQTNTTGTTHNCSAQCRAINTIARTPNAPRRPIRRHQSSRQGTALLLVIGLLALVSVLAVVYAAVGRSDTRISQAVVSQNEQRDAAKLVGDYIASIIADDVFSTIPAPGGRNFSTLETFDYPSTSPDATSTQINPTQPDYFRPTGSRLGSDPYLAATHPSWHGNPAVLVNANQDEISATRVGYSNISVFSPDGRFVNLFNLRNRGWDVGNLTDTTNNFNNSIYGRPVVLRTRADAVPGAIEPVIITGAQPTPAQLASLTRVTSGPSSGYITGVFARPVADLENQLNSALFLPYSFADTTGDGFIDARWIELADSRLVTNNGRATPIIDTNDGIRWFVAVRAIDLASKINVNTATDRYADAIPTLPLGLTTADVDLRRIMTTQDIFNTHGELVYDRLQIPQGVYPAAADFENYNRFRANAAGTHGFFGLIYSITTGDVPPFDTPLFANRTYTPFPRAVDRLYWSLLQGGSGLYTNNQGVSLSGFTLHDELELRAFGILNNPITLSPIERAIDGGVGPNDRRGPALSQRTSEIERLTPELALEPGNITSEQANARRAVDIRSQLTTASAARQITSLRPIPNNAIDPTTGLASAINTDDIPQRLDQLLNIPQFLIPNNYTFEPRNQDPSTPSNYFLQLSNLVNPYRLAPTINNANTSEPGRANQLFHIIVRALMPALHDADPTNPPAEGWRPQRRTEVYGYNPEFAWRAAGHIVANLAAMVQGPTDGNRFPAVPFTQTLVDNDQGRTQIPTELDPTRFPAFNEAFELNPPRSLQATAARPNNGDIDNALVGNDISNTANIMGLNGLNPRTQNIYGVRPYPVMLGVAFYTFHVDAPQSMGGDNEVANAFAPSGVPSDFDPSDNMFPENPIPITIDPRISDGNTDFLMEAVAFQIHNPFPVPLRLSGDDDFDFYIEFGGHYFPLIDSKPDGTPEDSGITLAAGETRTFYATSPFSRDRANERWRNLRNAAAMLGYDVSAFSSDDFVREFAASRFSNSGGVTGTPVHIVPYTGMFALAEQNLLFSDPNYANPSGDTVIDLLANDAQTSSYFGANDDRTRSAMIWRVVRSDPHTSASGSTLATDPTQLILSDITPTANRGGNHRWNDELVDRIQDNPTASPAIRRLLDSNSTYSFILSSGGNQIGAGLEDDIPARRGSNTARLVATYAGMWRSGGPGGTVDSGAIQPYMLEGKIDEEWRGGSTGAPRPWFNNQDQYQDGSPAENWIQFDIYSFDDPGAAFSSLLNTGGLVDIPEIRAAPNSDARGTSFTAATHPNNLSYSEVAFSLPMLLRDQDRIASLFRRPADVLLALAVGPSYDPGAAGVIGGTETRHTQLQKQWTTFGEAAAMAMGYQWHENVNHPYHRAGAGLAAAPYGDRLVQGRLRLDSYVPFISSTSPTSFDITTAPVFNQQNNDRQIGLGIPAALAILDGIRASTPFGITTPVAGQVSINTASTDVLRALPLMAYNFDQNRSTNENDLLEDRDAAAALFAYREKAAEINRSLNPTFNNGLIAFLDQNPANPLGRGLVTGITGIRETRGFRSPAELLAITIVPSNTTPEFSQARREFAFTGFADDGDELTEAFSPVAALANRLQRTTDDYSESLIAYNAVANTVTARSDVFAVWFLLHGYTDSDTQGLGPNDPLIPTVARRFLMIVDRSNVVTQGDKPRILMFQELPL